MSPAGVVTASAPTGGSPIRRVLDLLPGHKQVSAGSWMAHCPGVAHANGDKNPSLSVKETEDGAVLLHCFVGCSVALDILPRLGLQPRSLFPQSTQQRLAQGKQPARYVSPEKAAENSARYAKATIGGLWTYMRADGTPAMAVARLNFPNGRKEFRQMRHEGSTWILRAPPAPLVIYRLPEVLAASTARIYWVEGEKACEALRELGPDLVVTTTAGGAKGASKADLSPAAGREVVLLPDNDDPGRKYARDIARGLLALAPPARVFQVDLPDLPEAGDVFDWIAARSDLEPAIIREQFDAIERRPMAAVPAEAADRSADATGGVLLKSEKPLPSAREFVKREAPHLIEINGDLLDYVGPHYDAVEQSLLRQRIYRFLDSCFSPKKKHVDECIDALRAEVVLPRDKFAPPCWLEGEGPKPLELVPCANGLLHLATGELLTPTPRFFSRHALAIAYDLNAPMPKRFLQFLTELWGDDLESIGTLQEWLGYLLTADTSQQKILLLLGPTRAGKGIILRVITELVGIRNICSPSLANIGDRFALQTLLGKTVATIADMRLDKKTNLAAIAENLLRISGGDTVDVSRKHRDDWTGRLAARFVIVTNELPNFRDGSGALAARIVPLVLSRSFVGSEDTQLFDKLRLELPGILRWAAEGWRRLHERGHFVVPAASAAVASSLAARAHPVRGFVSERCLLAVERSTPKADVYAGWSAWCQQRRLAPGTDGWFARELLAACPGVRSARPRDGDGDRLYVFEGIALAEGRP